MLKAEFVSVTCEASEEGCLWWLTRESGRRPSCIDGNECSCNPCTEPFHQACKAYLIVKVRASTRQEESVSVIFSELSKDTLEVTLAKVLPRFVSALERNGKVKMKVIGNLTEGLGKGQFSSLEECHCQAGWKKCDMCDAIPSREWRFLPELVYPAVCRSAGSAEHRSWFLGVSDGVGDVLWEDTPWLSCPNERQYVVEE